ncbi:MAG TPA: indolepyruvate/phenylpyruvate decarboxylase [Vicinamibacterales bacterium]|nr:indolepyruvate/phenylpyruvate decarboxylase [Vicinamibacterales bacterium]
MTGITLGSFLFDQLWARGVRHIFGIPGDFVLNLYEALERDGRFGLVRLSHEPAVGFAADGSARITGGLGVCCVTYGAGGLNMVNSVACAYAEESPLVVLSGGPGRIEKRAGLPVHHEVKSFESQLRVYAEVTEYSAILDDPRTAAAHIARALDVAVKLKRPVYLEIPRDMVDAPIDGPAPDAALELNTDEGAVTEAVAEITERLSAAERPVLIVGVEVHRFQLRDQVVRLAERMGVPVASSFLGRGVFPSRHLQFAGTYLGVVSPQPLRDIVENSDCVLLLGELISDTSLGVSAQRLDERNLIICVAREVFVGYHRYQDTPLERIVAGLLESPALGSWPPHAPAVPVPMSGGTEPRSADSAPMTAARLIEAANEFVEAHPDVPLVSDTGDCLFAAVEIQSNDCVAPAYYATMGFAVPAALGLQVSSGRRPLVLVGDGAFQMTGSEIAHATPLGCNPIVVLLNNNRWEMLQAFYPHARYNETVPWPFARLAELWGGRGVVAGTIGELRAALREAWQAPVFTLIEVPLAKGDISPVLSRFVKAFKERVYR